MMMMREHRNQECDLGAETLVWTASPDVEQGTQPQLMRDETMA